MANTRQLVGRRRAIRNIRKITRTMELIATSRFKRALDRATEAEAYTRKIAELAADLSAAATNVSHPLLQKRDEVKKVLLLVIGSNRGLCGGYNAGILREANQRLRQLTGQGVPVQLELSGKRPIAFFRYQGVAPAKTFTHFEDKPRFDEVEELANRYLADFIAGKVDRVEVAYMKFLNAARQVPVVDVLLPLSKAAPETRRRGSEAEEKKQQVEYEFLPGPKEILEQLLPESFKVRLFKCFLDAAVSEQIARRVTMKAATENADDMIKNLTRQYNRARQAQITKEIAEVIGGAAALEQSHSHPRGMWRRRRMEDSTAGTVVLVRAVHDEAATRDKHTRSGKQVTKALRKGLEVHVFNDGVDLNALEARVWNEGTYLGKIGIEHRLEFERFIWHSPAPIGRRIQAGTIDLPLSWVEIKGKIQNGVWLYHLTPRRKPPA